MTFRLGLIALGLAGWLTASTVAADDIEVLARGPVHEAYAEPSEREPKPTPIVPKAPPKPIEELPPDQKPEGDNVQWMPGYWAMDDDKKDFLWVSGFWRNSPPNRSWVPGSWRQTPDGWQWIGGFWSAANGGKAQVEYLPQPPAPLDNAGPTTPAPSETHVYVPGSWMYRERYVWRPGFWSEYRPGLCWTAAHYRWTPAGYVFLDGYWDYPLAERGVLFAPVYIPPIVYAAPDFVYTPTYVVREDCLFGAFFCRRGYGSYYFGDYFAPSYASVGYSAWCGNVGISVGIGFGRWHDPLFDYYRCGFRSDPFWGGGGIHDLYAGRYRGDYLRPSVNLVQQNTVINNITNNHTTVVNNSNLNNVTMVSSLNNVAKSGRHNLQPVTDPARRQFAQTAQGVRESGARRAAVETELAARPGAGGRTAAPRTASLDVPPSTSMAKGTGPKVDPLVLTPPRPASTRVVPAAKGTAVGRTDPPAALGTPGTGSAALRGNPKPPITPKGTGVDLPRNDPGLRQPTVEPKALPKVPAPKTVPLPKADVPRTNPVVPPKTNSVVPPKSNPVVPPKANLVVPPSASPRTNPPVARSFAAPVAKPAPPRPPVSYPKPPSLPAAPRSLPAPAAPRMAAAAAVPKAAPRLGPVAAPPVQRPAAVPARPVPKKGNG